MRKRTESAKHGNERTHHSRHEYCSHQQKHNKCHRNNNAVSNMRCIPSTVLVLLLLSRKEFVVAIYTAVDILIMFR